MERHDHLRLPIYHGNVERQKRGGGGGYSLPEGRRKAAFSRTARRKAETISQSFATLKRKFAGRITPSLIYEIEINQSVSPDAFENTLSSMGIHVLSVAENRKGFWVVFSDDENLSGFKNKLAKYGSETGPKYDFFNAIDSFQDIPREKKIGKRLKDAPLGETPEFIDIELWRMTDPRKNERFIHELKDAYPNRSQFRITDTLISKTFVLVRARLTAQIFDEIIELKEISRADRPCLPQFNPFEYTRPDVSTIEVNEPDDAAHGILIVDSGIISNHPMLEKCVGGEENFQAGEAEIQDTVGHGTAVAGCAAYGDIEKCLDAKNFTPANWIFSAKVLYAERNVFTGEICSVYDPEKLVEHQLKDAVESFLANPEYHIRAVNISLGNANEVWHKHYYRQLPLAALIDELAFDFPDVVFVVSAGNQDPTGFYGSIADIQSNYPVYLTQNPNFRIINPATASLALTIGSIAGEVRIERERYGAEQIKTPIADECQPSPFTRSGFGINGMIKPELVEYGGNLILFDNYGRITQDRGGKIPLLNNRATEDIIQYDCGTSFAAPKVAYLAGKIANYFPQRSGNFIKNMLLMGAEYPVAPNKEFYQTDKAKYAEKAHLMVCGYGLSDFERAVNSFNNRAILWDEGQIGLNQMNVYALNLPDIFFAEPGKKKIIITLTFNPETRLTRGDSYLGNRMEFHVFHSINPQSLIEKYGVIKEQTEQTGVPEGLKKFEIDFFPGPNSRKAGCHQKAWKVYKRDPKSRPSSPISLVLLNFNKWITDENRIQDYCISVAFEHEKEISLYTEIRTSIQTRVRVEALSR
ncbi:S8 family peptidase [Desulfobacter postgatei]|uniref:Subtilisin-like serine protease n=1 Tax=Desulfobacter postgatei 2ac9 TaxID=879212 RepID=I5AYS3_9BACT|nr:S8 family peptidase [Desulfobacter postgatei]EIM62386.1 subtilisin-like serine protease [Desulfobacter postgatei 2ac9]